MKNKKKEPVIILVDDQPDAIEPMEIILAYEGYPLIIATTIDEGIAALHETPPGVLAVAVIDRHLNDPTGLDGWDLIDYAAGTVGDRVVTVAWSADTSEKCFNEAMESGADFVLPKPYSPNAMLKFLESSRTLARVKGSLRDALTGLRNLREFERLVVDEFKTASTRKGAPKQFSLILLDINRFKSEINEMLGYRVGNEVLKALAGHLSKSVRPSDHPARMAGDEFLVLLPGTSRNQAIKTGQKLQAGVDALLVETDQGPIHFSISFGVGHILTKDIGFPPAAFAKILNDADLGPDGLKTQKARLSIGR